MTNELEISKCAIAIQGLVEGWATLTRGRGLLDSRSTSFMPNKLFRGPIKIITIELGGFEASKTPPFAGLHMTLQYLSKKEVYGIKLIHPVHLPLMYEVALRNLVTQVQKREPDQVLGKNETPDAPKEAPMMTFGEKLL